MIGTINRRARGLSPKGIFAVWMLFSSGISTTVLAAEVKVTWDASIQPEVTGYNLYFGTTSRSYGTKINIGNQTSYTVTGLAGGTYYFVVTAYNASGVESGF